MTRWAVMGLLVLLAAWGSLRAFAWLDVPSFCRIAIDVELLEGDRGAIRDAIDVVRREDPLAYRALCQWVDRIQEERQCDAGDPQVDPRIRAGAGVSRDALDPLLRRAREAPGCYVKGSRIIVLRRAASRAPVKSELADLSFYWLTAMAQPLIPDERALLAKHCKDHPVATCRQCSEALTFDRIGEDLVLGRRDLCPVCRADLTFALRQHLAECTVFRLQALEAGERAQGLRQETRAHARPARGGDSRRSADR